MVAWPGMQAKQWKMLADLEMERGNLESAKNIFSKCLLSCYNVDLWSSYMRYIKQVRPFVFSTVNRNTAACITKTIQPLAFQIQFIRLHYKYREKPSTQR